MSNHQAIDVQLCENGLVRSGTASFTCTGSAHLMNGQLLRCTDPSHTVPEPTITLGVNLTIGPATTGSLVGQTWTCS